MSLQLRAVALLLLALVADALPAECDADANAPSPPQKFLSISWWRQLLGGGERSHEAPRPTPPTPLPPPPPALADASPSCPKWAASGACSTNPSFMKKLKTFLDEHAGQWHFNKNSKKQIHEF